LGVPALNDGVRARRSVVDPGQGPQVDHVEDVEPEPPEVVVYLFAQRRWRLAGQPAALVVAAARSRGGPKTPGPASCIEP